jgi:uncharacterized protein
MLEQYAERACEYARIRLQNELSPTLCYHSLVHTRDDVVPAAERLAASAGITDGGDLLLLRTAAWYHDLGFVERRDQHECAGAAIAMAALPLFGYSGDEITTVVNMILATQLPQAPRTRLEQILVDADLDSLGREDFFTTSLALRDELAAAGMTTTRKEWYQRQLRFLRSHRYFTLEARRLRDAQKQHNIARLESLSGGAF